MKGGFSVIEVIIAAAIFMIFAVATGTVVLQGFSGNRLSEEQTIANQYAAEGLEAARSIKNQSFNKLINTAGTGILQSSGVWTFSGTNNQFGPNNKYTRVLSVADVNRDASGNIVANGGTLDPNTKKISSTVNWNFGPTRPDSVVLSTYLTNFRKLMGGFLIYGDGPTTPKYRTFDSTANTFSAQTNTLAISSGLSFVMRTSPTKGEAIAAYVFTTGGLSTLQVMCFDGSTWSNEWTASVGTATPTRKFDIAYETNSGDVMVLYSRGTTTNELGYRTKAGNSGCGSANWASATTLNAADTTGTVLWVKMAWDRRASSNLITAIWADVNSTVSSMSTMVWNGSAWGNEPPAALETNLEFATAAQDVESFDVEYESGGDTMVVWSSNGNNATGLLKSRKCTANGVTGCTWAASATTIPTVNCAGTNLDISANPDSNEIVLGAMDNGNQKRLCMAYWSGSVWTGNTALDTSTTNQLTGGTKLVSTGWLISGATTRSIVVYNDNAARDIRYFVCNTRICAINTSFPASPLFANPQKYYDIQMDPLNKDRLMFTLSDSANNLFAKRLTMTATPTFTWTNSDGGAALTTTLPQAINGPFSFAFWRN